MKVAFRLVQKKPAPEPLPTHPTTAKIQSSNDCSTTTIMNSVTTTTSNKSTKAIFNFVARCTCGKVEVAIQTLETAPPLRLVCYCKDCRGYYESLDRLAIEKGLPPAGILDVSTSFSWFRILCVVLFLWQLKSRKHKVLIFVFLSHLVFLYNRWQSWGGVDWTAMYPRDITITKGKDLLQTTVIRPSSTVRQVYASCCHTPMFRFGEMSVVGKRNGRKKQHWSHCCWNIVTKPLAFCSRFFCHF